MKPAVNIIRKHLAFISIVLFYCLYNIPKVNYFHAWYDEIISVYYSQLGIGKILEVFTRETNPPLYYVFIHTASLIFGNTETSLRLITFSLSVLNIFLIYVLIKKHFKNTSQAILGSVIAALSDFYIFFAFQIRSYQLFITISLAILFYVLILTKEKQKQWLTIYFLLLLLGMYTHVAFLFFIFLITLFLLLESKNNEVLKKLIIINTLSVVIVFLFYIVNIPSPIHNMMNIAKLNYEKSSVSYIPQNLMLLPDLYWHFSSPIKVTLFYILYILGMIYLYIKQKTFFKLSAIVTVGSFLLFFVTVPDPYTKTRFIVFDYPILMSIFSYALINLSASINNYLKISFGRTSKMVLYISTILISSALIFYLCLNYIIQSNTYKKPSCIQRTLSNIPVKETLILTEPSWDKDLYNYYDPYKHTIRGINTENDPLGKGLSTEDDMALNLHPVITDSSAQYLQNYIKGYNKVIFLSTFPQIDKEEIALNWLKTHSQSYKKLKFSCEENEGYQNSLYYVFEFK